MSEKISCSSASQNDFPGGSDFYILIIFDLIFFSSSAYVSSVFVDCRFCFSWRIWPFVVASTGCIFLILGL